MNINELTRKLIDVPSVTGDEKCVGEFLASHLEDLGYQVKRQEVAADRFNVIATTNAPPRVVLSTHMDTVPPYYVSSENEERIFGRGACDAKGIIAAQIVAAERLRGEGIQEIGLLFTVDEEQGSLGAQVANLGKPAFSSAYLINGEPTDNKLASATKGSLRLNLRTKGHAAHSAYPEQGEYLINGEPTENRLASATKGSLRLNLRTKGRAAHSAYPEQGESAIEKMLDVLQSIRACEWPEDGVLGETTCNIGVICGGTRANVVPEEASADLQLRLVSRADVVRKILEDAIAGRAEVEYLSKHEPVHLHAIDDFEQCIVRFTTDIPYLSKWGTPLLLGPGSILNAHTDHEFVEKRELSEAVDLYVRLVRALLASEPQALETVEGASR